MNARTFDTREGGCAGREVLKYFAETVPVKPVVEALKLHVWKYELAQILDGWCLTFFVDTDEARKALMRCHDRLLIAAKAGYLAQVDIHITALEVTVL